MRAGRLLGLACIVLGVCGTEVMHRAAAATPAPTVLSDDDAVLARAALEAAQRKRWSSARATAGEASEPLVSELIDWLRLRDESSGAGFDDIAEFIDRHPDWPGRRKLRARAEDAMPEAMSAGQVLSWFDSHPPISGRGKRLLGEALVAVGDIERGRELLREVWVEHDFSSRDEKSFLARHKNLLGPDDHPERLDRLLWDRRFGAARRQMKRVDSGHRKLARARIALNRRQGGVDAAIGRVPEELLANPGLIYERVRWRRRAGLIDTATSLLADTPGDPVRPAKWWSERHRLARASLREGWISDAYRLAAGHGQITAAGIAEAEWLAGWIALRFLEEPIWAYRHFQAMHEVVRMPISIGRAAYWSGRAADAAGAPAEARKWYLRAVAHPTSFYGQIAAAALGQKALMLPPTQHSDSAATPGLETRSVVRLARMLGEMAEIDLMATVLAHLVDGAQTPLERAGIAMLGLQYGLPSPSIRAAKKAARAGTLVIPAAFPVVPAFVERERSGMPDASLLLGVARQESEFASHRVSRAGARGLMQLLPDTAKMMARQLGVRYRRQALVADPSYNIRLGATYLAGLLEDYGGAQVLALAAYNAGPGRVKRWLREHGDPRDPAVGVIDWIELIPLAETRNYVQRVLENAQVYRHLLADPVNPPGLRIAEHIIGIPGPLARR